MVNLFQAIFSGVVQGGVYALIALGYSIIFRTLRMGHFAQGEFYMFGAFLGLQFITIWKLPALVSIILAMVGTSVLMLVVEKLAYRKLYSAPLALLMSTMGMQYVIQEIARDIWGADVYKSKSIFPDGSFSVGPFVFKYDYLLILCISFGLILAFSLFMSKTKTGMAMNAVAMNRKAAALMGIRNEKIIRITYILAACMAAVAGVMMGPIYSVKYSMGTTFGNKALTAAVMGGFGSLPGAFLGSVLLGIIESLTNLYIGSKYGDVVTFIILVIVLFAKPQGLLGKKSTSKV